VRVLTLLKYHSLNEAEIISFVSRVYGSRDLSRYSDGLGNTGFIAGKGNTFFSSVQCPNRHSGLPVLLYIGYLGLFLRWVRRPRREADHLLPRLGTVELHFHCPLYLDDVVLNYLSTGTNSLTSTHVIVIDPS
jgi:hypothetical protein